MIVSLVVLWKRPHWTPLPIVLALLVLLLGGNGWISDSIVRSLEWQNIPTTPLPTADAIVVLGGATKAAFPPRPAPDLSEEGDRVFYGAQLYREGKAPIVIASGGRIEWKGSGPPESGDMAVILETLGVPKEAIIEEPRSLNTYENALYVRQILQEKGIKRVLLVTSAMHMPRSLLIFKRQGIEAIPAPTDFLVTEADINETSSTPQAILLNAVPDADNLYKTTRALKEYLGKVVYSLKGWL